MIKKEFIITATEDNGRARIDIIGDISEWNENNANTFRNSINQLITKGIANAHIYINSGGGDCFQANEIENILKAFKGTVTGEGGALVASAASYLAIGINNFIIAENCQFMIHKPSTVACGNDKEIENKLKLLKNITEQYRNAYIAKTTLSENEFMEKWNGGDWWLTSHEAKQYGFVSSVISNNSETSAQMIAAYYGNNYNNQSTKTNQTMNYNGQTFKQLQDENPELLAQIEKENPALFQSLFNASYGNTNGANNQPVNTNPLQISDYNGKTFEQLQDENHELLAQIESQNPALFQSLFEDYKRRHNL